MTFYIIPIVEGQTEQRSIERLLHRVWRELLGRVERLQVLPPFRGKRDQLLHPDGRVLNEFVKTAYEKLERTIKDADSRSVVLLLLDAEEDCPATLAPALLNRAKAALPEEALVFCVFAKRMLEKLDRRRFLFAWVP